MQDKQNTPVKNIITSHCHNDLIRSHELFITNPRFYLYIFPFPPLLFSLHSLPHPSLYLEKHFIPTATKEKINTPCSKPTRLRLPRVQVITNNSWGTIWKVSHASLVMISVAFWWLTWGGVDDCLCHTSSSGLKIGTLTLLGTTWCLYDRSWVGSTNILMCVSALSMSFQC